METPKSGTAVPAWKYDPLRLCDPQDVVFGYRLLLGREPEPQAVQSLAGTRSVAQFVRELAGSPEHRALTASAHKSRLCSREDVTYVYRLCLHREPESEQLFREHVDRTEALTLMKDTWRGGSCQAILASVLPPPVSAPEPKEEPLAVHMHPAEQTCLAAFLGASSTFVEFGCGGSTVLACQLVSTSIMAVDSVPAWLEKVRRACAGFPTRPQPRLVHADIGPTGPWGTPLDESCRARWPRYSTDVWQYEGAASADLYLIDGRFRLACALETLMRCRPDAILLIHDYPQRSAYHVIEQFARPIASCETLAAFLRRKDFARRPAAQALRHARYQTL